MIGTIDRAGNCTITFNLQEERLSAPGGRQWLPCDSCGRVEAVEPKVVCFYCVQCSQDLDDIERPDYATMGGSVLTGRE